MQYTSTGSSATALVDFPVINVEASVYEAFRNLLSENSSANGLVNVSINDVGTNGWRTWREEVRILIEGTMIQS